MDFPMVCQEILPWFGLTAKGTLWERTPESPTNIIHTNEQWGVVVQWKTTGPLNHLISGAWKLDCYLEKMGPGEAPTLPPATVAFVSRPNDYRAVLTFPPMAEGVYKLATTITMKGPLGVPGPIAAMGEGPMIEFFSAVI
jgi:hypothetical protein